MKNIVKGLIIVLAVSLLGACGFAGYTYFNGKDYFSGHFYEGTTFEVLDPDSSFTVFEGDLSGLDIEEAIALIEGMETPYKLIITGYEGTTDTITGEEIDFGLAEDLTATLSTLLQAQNAKEWFKNATGLKTAYKETRLTLHYNYNADKLSDVIANLQVINPEEKVESTSSELIYNTDTLLYEFIPAKTGNLGDAEIITPIVEDAVKVMGTEITLTEDDYLKAEANDDEFLQAKADEINKYLSADITVKDGDKSIEIDKSIIIDFLDITDDWTVTLDSAKIRSYVNKNFDSLFDTVGIKRTISTPSSGTITVSGGTFGKTVRTLDEVPALVEEITNGVTTEREPHYYDTCANSSENAGVGYTYIDVNITSQMVYLVKDGKITFSTACVTGLDSDERRTPTGVYYVLRKVRDYTMVKYNSFVSYWMPINDATGVGLHDASWRSTFGGSIWKTNGSHGCINLPTAAAKTIFESVSAGIPVIVHY